MTVPVEVHVRYIADFDVRLLRAWFNSEPEIRDPASRSVIWLPSEEFDKMVDRRAGLLRTAFDGVTVDLGTISLRPARDVGDMDFSRRNYLLLPGEISSQGTME